MHSEMDWDKQFEDKVMDLLDALYGAALRLAKNQDDAEWRKQLRRPGLIGND